MYDRQSVAFPSIFFLTLLFHILSDLECTVFCEIKSDQDFREDFNVFKGG